MNTNPYSIKSLLVALLLILITDCDKQESSKTDYKEWWGSQKYALVWNFPAGVGFSDIRFLGRVQECPISNFYCQVHIWGFMPSDEGNIDISIHDTISKKLSVPDTPPSLQYREIEADLTGTLKTPKGHVCDLEMRVNIKFSVDVGNNTGTLIYPDTGIKSGQLTCLGISASYPVPFSSLLIENKSIPGSDKCE